MIIVVCMQLRYSGKKKVVSISVHHGGGGRRRRRPWKLSGENMSTDCVVEVHLLYWKSYNFRHQQLE